MPRKGTLMTSRPYSDPPLSRGKAAWSVGLSALAGMLLLLAGAFGFFQGLAAVVKGDFFVATAHNTYALNVSAWGWIHLILGIIAIGIGFAILAGRTWARIAGIILALLSAASNFMFIPYYPIWAILIIALDVAVIWALTNYDRAK
jgi:hypothetical protein